MRLLFAHIDFFVCDFAIGESVNQTIHALQATPLGFTVDFQVFDLLFKVPENFEFGVIAPSISFTCIF
jgi:hypothetical protein